MINPDDIRKLLGGYPTGTLTPEEQQALFEAALDDQELFDALAREQSLRDLLRDPAARGQLLAAMDERPLPWYRRFWRPLAMAAAAAAGLVCAGIYLNHSATPSVKPVLMGEVHPEPPPETSMPAAAEPAVKPAPRRQKTKVKEEAAAAPAPIPAAPAAAAAASDAKQTVELAAPVPAAAPPPLLRATSGTLAQNLAEPNSQTISLQNAQAMFYAGEQKKAARAQAALYMGVKLTILRQRDGGDFAEVGPDQIAAGDSVKLRLIPNDDGFVSISEGASLILQPTAVRRMQPLYSPAITSAQPSRKMLTVQFTRMQGQQSQTANGFMPQQQSATDSQEHATYVLKVNSSEPVSVQVPLVFK